MIISLWESVSRLQASLCVTSQFQKPILSRFLSLFFEQLRRRLLSFKGAVGPYGDVGFLNRNSPAMGDIKTSEMTSPGRDESFEQWRRIFLGYCPNALRQKINPYEEALYLMNWELITPQVRKKRRYDSLYIFVVRCIKYDISIRGAYDKFAAFFSYGHLKLS